MAAAEKPAGTGGATTGGPIGLALRLRRNGVRHVELRRKIGERGAANARRVEYR